MSKVNGQKAQPEQKLDFSAGSDDFESSVLEAARHQANLMIAKTKKDSEALQRSILGESAVDVVLAHRTECEAQMRRTVAAEKQENRKKLLVYRRQLVNGLFAEEQENLEAYTKTPQYEGYLVRKAAKHANAGEGCIVRVRPADMIYAAALQKALPGCTVQPDAGIRVGGLKVVAGRVLYDETLDDAMREQRAQFLVRCKLCVE